MAVYCVRVPDEGILAELEDARSVLIIGCPSCSSIRYALDSDLPVAAVTLGGIRSACVEKEMDRWTQLLAGKNLQVETWLLRVPQHLCEVDRDALQKASRRYQSIDAVIVLGCHLGKENVEDSFRGAKTICTLKAEGLISFPVVRKLNKMFPDRERVNIYPFEVLPDQREKTWRSTPK